MIIPHAKARVTPVNCRSKSENPRNWRAESVVSPNFRFQISALSNFTLGLSWSTDYKYWPETFLPKCRIQPIFQPDQRI